MKYSPDSSNEDKAEADARVEKLKLDGCGTFDFENS